ncbi:helix-turn-helix domain-containing protein [Streptomyces sp. NPDC053474]|uniref:helix-turn-helix domain-containing protein n=1 Tax=Streptomyces sp. NPDC053474 TaxID=3365704 RepID=UPI0037D1BC89
MGTSAGRRRALAKRRAAMGFSQEEFAHALGVDRTTVGRWETGERDPQPWTRPTIATALHLSLGELDALLSETEPVHTLAAGMVRRAADIPAQSGPGFEARERQSYIHANPGALDLVAVAQLRKEIQNLDARYETEPSTALVAQCGQHLGQVAHWHTYPLTHQVRRDLHAAYAEAATLMGQLVWDASGRRDHATARAYFTHAATAARELGDPVAEGLALLRTSFVALYGDRNPKAGLELAQHTATITGTTSHVLTGLAVLHTAEAHAMTGARSQCERALSQAETRLGRVDGSDAAAPLYASTQFGRLAGSCYLALNDAARAQALLEETAADSHDGSKASAIVHANLALAHTGQGHVHEAVAALHAALDVVEQHRGGGGMSVAFSAGLALKPWRTTTAVGDVYDRLLTLMTAA